MKERLLEFLTAPETHNPFQITVLSSDGGEIIDGYLTGSDNEEIFPVIDGIPSMILGSFARRRRTLVERYGAEKIPEAPGNTAAYLTRKEMKTRSGFDLQIARSGAATHFLTRVPSVFCAAIGVALKEAPTRLSGKVMLDAGAGGGQYTFDALNLGAEVIALDINTVGLQFLHRQVRANPMAHVVEGNLLQLPLKTEAIDLAFSIGVLHHSADVRKGLRELARCTRLGGDVVVGVYPKYRLWRYYTLMRFFTTRLPLRLLWYLCYPLALISYIPGMEHFCHPWVEKEEPFKSRVTGAFDHFHPPYQGYYSPEEITGWFHGLGCFSPPTFTPFGACKATKIKKLEA